MYMGWHVFQKASNINCKVMLNGQGSDEVFLGYERYFSVSMDVINPISFLYRAYQFSKNSRVSFKNVLLYYFYFRNFQLRALRAKRNNFFKESVVSAYGLQNIKLSAQSYNSPFSLQKFEIESIQLPHLLRYEDRNSMRHSVETRLPFLDPRLVEFAVNLPLKYKLRDGWSKYILRKVASEYIKDDVTWRKEKFGFEAPSNTWFSTFGSEMLKYILGNSFLDRYIDKDKVKANFYQMSDRHRWSLFNTAVWSQVYDLR